MRSFSCRYPGKKKQDHLWITFPRWDFQRNNSLDTSSNADISQSWESCCHPEAQQPTARVNQGSGRKSPQKNTRDRLSTLHISHTTGAEGKTVPLCTVVMGGILDDSARSQAQMPSSTYNAGDESIFSSCFPRTILSSHPLRLTAFPPTSVTWGSQHRHERVFLAMKPLAPPFSCTQESRSGPGWEITAHHQRPPCDLFHHPPPLRLELITQ